MNKLTVAESPAPLMLLSSLLTTFAAAFLVVFGLVRSDMQMEMLRQFEKYINSDKLCVHLMANALHIYSYKGEVSGLKMVLDSRKYSVNSVTIDGRSPLHLAIMGNNFEAVKLLINYGADYNLRTSYNDTPIMYAAKEGNFVIFAYLYLIPDIDLNGVTTDHLTLRSFKLSRDFLAYKQKRKRLRRDKLSF